MNMRQHLQNMLAENDKRRRDDAERFAAHDHDECMLCGAVGPDMRSLFVSCFYAVHEVVPEAIDLKDCPEEALRNRGYYLRICKDCRGRFLGAMEEWRGECVAKRGQPMDEDGHPDDTDDDGNEVGPGTDRDIPVREHGRIVWLTAEEYAERCPGREPVRMVEGADDGNVS